MFVYMEVCIQDAVSIKMYQNKRINEKQHGILSLFICFSFSISSFLPLSENI